MPFTIEFRGYEKDGRMRAIEYIYKNEPGVKKIPSWGAHFTGLDAVFSSAEPGDKIEITTQKNDKGYVDWINAEKSGEASSPIKNNPPTVATRNSGYESTEERARRQLYIIRQSSLANACEVLKSRGTLFSAGDTIEIADVFVNYVLGNEGSLEPNTDE